MRLTLVTGSTDFPISLADAKDHMGITSNDFDAVVEGKIRAATEYCEKRISGSRKFMTATYDGDLPNWPRDNRIELPIPPLSSVTSVKYIDTNGAEQTLSSTAYDVFTPTDEPGFIDPAFDETWPETRPVANAVTVRFIAGYSSQAVVPETIKEAVRKVAGDFMDNREASVIGPSNSALIQGVDRLLGCNEYGDYD